MLSQSAAILRFLAKRHNLIGRDEFEAARADELTCYHYDRVQEQLNYLLFKLSIPGFTDGVNSAVLGRSS